MNHKFKIGSLSPAEGSQYSEQYVEIDSSLLYKWNSGTYYVATYDADKNFLSRIKITALPYAFDSNVKYIRLSKYQSKFSEKFLLNSVDDYPNEYVSYDSPSVNAYSTNLVEQKQIEKISRYSKCTDYIKQAYIYDGTGELTDDTGWSAYQIYVENDIDIWTDSNVTTASDMMVGIYDGEVVSSKFINPRYRKNVSSESSTTKRLPTEENKLHVFGGQIIVVSINSKIADFTIYASDFKLYKLKNSLNQIKRQTINYSPDGLYINIPTADGYIRYSLRHVSDIGQTVSKNTNVWAFDLIYKLDDDFNIVKQLTDSANIELAISVKKDGTSEYSYVGGMLHGHEIFNTFKVFVDGKQLDLTKIGTFEFTTVKIVEATELSHWDGSEKIANHGIEYVIDQSGVLVNQSLNWTKNVELLESSVYLGMLGPKKQLESTGEHITDTYYTNDDISPKTIPNVATYLYNSNKITMYGSDSDSVFDFEVTKQSYNYESKKTQLSVRDNGTNYNKIYNEFRIGNVKTNDNMQVSFKINVI